jgi:hypothetical protein
MAKSRCLPTDLLTDPDYIELDSHTQVILVMLVLTADDEGRGRAHTGMLARHFNKTPKQVEQAFAELADLEFVTRYTVGRHQYYQLLRWGEWQTLSKPTRSHFPAPPIAAQSACESLAEASRETQESPGEFWLEGEGEGKGKRREQNPEGKEESASVDRRTVPILSPSSASAACSEKLRDHSSGAESPVFPASPEPGSISVQQVARILQLPITEALTHVVTEYSALGEFALLGEADAAREWIDDPKRNQNQKPMTVAFFRRWLKREQESSEQRRAGHLHTSLHPLTETRGQPDSSHFRRTSLSSDGPRLPSLMHLAEEDRRLIEAIEAKRKAASA